MQRFYLRQEIIQEHSEHQRKALENLNWINQNSDYSTLLVLQRIIMIESDAIFHLIIHTGRWEVFCSQNANAGLSKTCYTKDTVN